MGSCSEIVDMRRPTARAARQHCRKVSVRHGRLHCFLRQRLQQAPSLVQNQPVQQQEQQEQQEPRDVEQTAGQSSEASQVCEEPVEDSCGLS